MYSCVFSLRPRFPIYEVINVPEYQESLSVQEISLELKAFSEGTSTHAWRCFGAHPANDGQGGEGYFFRVWAPNAARVSIMGDFNGWDPEATPMEWREGGIWEAFLPGRTRYDNYQYAIYRRDGSYIGKCDPYAFHAETRPDHASKLYPLEDGYTWGDQSWIAYRAKQSASTAPINIYECHLGSWRRTGDGRLLSYRVLADYLVTYVKEMGFTHVEFLPLMEHPLDASWGYHCTGYFAATSRFGTPDDFKYLIDQLHQAGVGVLMDWVPAYFPRDSYGLFYFDGTAAYEYADPRQGEQADLEVNFFDLSRNEVRSFLFSSAMFWLEEYHIDGLRVNEVSSMLYLDEGRPDGAWVPNCYGGRENLEAADFLRKLNTMVSETYPGVLMIAGESGTWPKVTHPVLDGGLGFHFQWDNKWIRSVCRYIKLDSYFRQTRHRDIIFSPVHINSEHYILPLSHERCIQRKKSFFGKQPGDDETRFAGVRAFYAYIMTHPGKKLTFMGTELAQRNEWNYEYSMDWHLLQYESTRKIQNYMKDINAFYLAEPALWEQDDSWQGFQWLAEEDAEECVLAFLRWDNAGRPLLVACNFSPIHHESYRVGVPFGGTWSPVFNSDGTAYGGGGRGDTTPCDTEEVPCHDQERSVVINLPPLSSVVYRCVQMNPIGRTRVVECGRSARRIHKTEAAKPIRKAAACSARKEGATEAADILRNGKLPMKKSTVPRRVAVPKKTSEKETI